MEVCPLEDAAGIAKRLTDIVLPDYPVQSGDEVCVLINGMGATPLNELYVLYNEVAKILDKKEIHIYKSYDGYDGRIPHHNKTR